MKNQNNIERIIADSKLTEENQIDLRNRLKPLAGLSGIESICLDNEELFIEYNPIQQNRDSIIAELRKTGFPSKQVEIQSVPAQESL